MFLTHGWTNSQPYCTEMAPVLVVYNLVDMALLEALRTPLLFLFGRHH